MKEPAEVAKTIAALTDSLSNRGAWVEMELLLREGGYTHRQMTKVREMAWLERKPTGENKP